MARRKGLWWSNATSRERLYLLGGVALAALLVALLGLFVSDAGNWPVRLLVWGSLIALILFSALRGGSR